jgi:hypothetical protein
MRNLIACALVLLAGCATLERGADQVRGFAHEHPIATAIAAGAAAGALASVVNDHRGRHGPELARAPHHGLHTRCAPAVHGDVYLPPTYDSEICR